MRRTDSDSQEEVSFARTMLGRRHPSKTTSRLYVLYELSHLFFLLLVLPLTRKLLLLAYVLIVLFSFVNVCVAFMVQFFIFFTSEAEGHCTGYGNYRGA